MAEASRHGTKRWRHQAMHPQPRADKVDGQQRRHHRALRPTVARHEQRLDASPAGIFLGPLHFADRPGAVALAEHVLQIGGLDALGGVLVQPVIERQAALAQMDQPVPILILAAHAVVAL